MTSPSWNEYPVIHQGMGTTGKEAEQNEHIMPREIKAVGRNNRRKREILIYKRPEENPQRVSEGARALYPG
jgi:hypothetical protein